MTIEQDVLELYTAMFNRVADYSGLNYWVNEMEQNNWSIVNVASSFADQKEYELAFPESNDASFFITTIYNNLLNRVPDSEGLNYWVNELESGSIAPEHATLAIINGAKANTSSRIDAELIANKTSVSFYSSNILKLDEVSSPDMLLSTVTSELTSVTQAKKTLDTIAANSYGADGLGVYDGHKYLIYSDPASYEDALTISKQVDSKANSSLVKIDSSKENDFVFELLKNYNITTSALDGGGSNYIWLGASDSIVEGNWLWSDGSVMEYENWGAKDGISEPDNFDGSLLGNNYTGQQDAAAMAVTDWSIGIAGQWNDLDGANQLAYIVEVF